jgi:Zn-dependent M28 family amino/carboxypeptidase
MFAKPNTDAMRRVLDGATKVRITLDPRPIHEAHSDHVPFAELGFEAIGFSTGHHRDYHRPSDTVDKIDWQGLHSISDFVTAAVRELAKK